MAAKRSGKKKKTKTAPARKQKAAARKPANRNPAAAKPAARKPAAAVEKPDPADLRVAEIQRIIDVMVHAGAVEVEISDQAGGRLRVRLKEDPPAVYTAGVAAAPVPAPVAARSTPSIPSLPTFVPDAPAIPASFAAAEEEEGETFVSPMVGTFYLSPSPESEPFINVGDTVTEETVICIIEAMKVMNKIEAETSGRIVAILVENGEPVEFGQPLFRIQRG